MSGAGKAVEPDPRPKENTRKLSGIGATEEQVDHRDTVPQRADKTGKTVEDQAGTGKTDAPGG